MGLDTVEIVMRIEEDFSIDLPDVELASVQTVGDLYELVVKKLDTKPSRLSSKAFYHTRRTLVECLGLPRRSIRPSTRLDSLLPRSSLVERWQELSDHAGLSFPALERRKRWTDSFLRADRSRFNVETAGDLASMVLTMNYSVFADGSQETPISREIAWARIVQIFCDQMQLAPEEIVPNARIGEDLGID